MKKVSLMGGLTALVAGLALSGGTAQAQSAYCREYTQAVNVGSRLESGYGTACMQPDGAWEIQRRQEAEPVIQNVQYYGPPAVIPQYYAPAPVYVAPPRTVVIAPQWGYGHKRHWRGHGRRHWDDDHGRGHGRGHWRHRAYSDPYPGSYRRGGHRSGGSVSLRW